VFDPCFILAFAIWLTSLLCGTSLNAVIGGDVFSASVPPICVFSLIRQATGLAYKTWERSVPHVAIFNGNGRLGVRGDVDWTGGADARR
jgi:hypothetical protein